MISREFHCCSPAVSTNRVILFYTVSKFPWFAMHFCNIFLPYFKRFSGYNQPSVPIFLVGAFLDFLFVHIYAQCILRELIRYEISMEQSHLRISIMSMSQQQSHSTIDRTNVFPSETKQVFSTIPSVNQNYSSVINKLHQEVVLSKRFRKKYTPHCISPFLFYLFFFILYYLVPFREFPLIKKGLRESLIILFLCYREAFEYKLGLSSSLSNVLVSVIDSPSVCNQESKVSRELELQDSGSFPFVQEEKGLENELVVYI